MRRRTRTFAVLAGILTVASLGLLAVVLLQIGGVQIRTASRIVELGTLVSEQTTLSPGAPTIFQVQLEHEPVPAQAVLRLAEGQVLLQPVSADDMQRGFFAITVPCSGAFLEADGALHGRVVLLAEDTGAALAQSGPLAVLPAGPDCFFGSH